MRWSERHRSMLQGMGIALWQPAGEAVEVEVPVVRAEGETTPVERPSPGPIGRPARTDAAHEAGPAMIAESEPPAKRATSATASLGWPALRDQVAGCTACGLCRTRTQTVFGVGNERAHWMIVGEAPGEQEDLHGEPFVGAAGRLLDRMLQSLDLTREPGKPHRQVYIANTLKCRPPGNRNPEPDELARCIPFLERQVALVQPRVVLAMGRFAVQALLGSTEPIGRLRGRVHDWQGRPLVVTYHPAYLLRQPTEKARAWADLCLAASALEQAGAGQPVEQG